VSRPRLLDLFSGAGGAAMGYCLAGFEVVGVDIKPQPHYPFEFYCEDAMSLLRAARVGSTRWTMRGGMCLDLDSFDAIHASPPCQFFTQMRASWRAQGVDDGYVDLLTPTLDSLRALSMPWVVENVVGARKAMGEVVTLHGAMFGLAVHRPRLFESNVFIMAPKQRVNAEPVGVYDSRPRGKTHHRTRLNGNGKGRSEMRIARTVEEGREAMGISWMDWPELKESIPPAYTKYIGGYLLAELRSRAKVAA
jgi:DNA (cytosine-5)-methyltransferase 1